MFSRSRTQQVGTIIGLSYITELCGILWKCVDRSGEKERERERYTDTKRDRRKRGRDFLCKFFFRLLATCFVNSNGVLRSFVRGCTSAANAGKRRKRAVAPNFSYVKVTFSMWFPFPQRNKLRGIVFVISRFSLNFFFYYPQIYTRTHAINIYAYNANSVSEKNRPV